MSRTAADAPTLSICLTCRDGREVASDAPRGGERLAQAVLARLAATPGMTEVRLRGVQCMSQCKRPCVAALTAPGRFAYLFGDLDPGDPEHVEALLALAPLHSAAPEGFLRREARPEALRARILGRLPPHETASDLVSPLCAAPPSMGASA